MIKARTGLPCKHSWSGINIGWISITTKKLVLETELSKHTQNSLCYQLAVFNGKYI